MVDEKSLNLWNEWILKVLKLEGQVIPSYVPTTYCSYSVTSVYISARMYVHSSSTLFLSLICDYESLRLRTLTLNPASEFQ